MSDINQIVKSFLQLSPNVIEADGFYHLSYKNITLKIRSNGFALGSNEMIWINSEFYKINPSIGLNIKNYVSKRLSLKEIDNIIQQSLRKSKFQKLNNETTD